VKRVHSGIDLGPRHVSGLPPTCCRMRLGRRAPTPPLIHGREGHQAPQWRQGLSCGHGGRLEGPPLVPQERFYRFAEVIHQMKTIDDLHRVGGSLADAIRIQGAAIATDDGDRRMLGQPGRDTGG
jgi:hypothetical protein